jgi:hypothetical protein
MVSGLSLGKVGGGHNGKASPNRSAYNGMVLANQMKQKMDQQAMVQRSNEEQKIFGSQPSKVTKKTKSEDNMGQEILNDPVMLKKKHFDLRLIGAIDELPDLMMRTGILPLELDSAVSKLENSSRGVIVNRHIWASDPMAARAAYNPPHDNLSVIFNDDDPVFCVENRKSREDDTLVTDGTESYDGTIDETPSYSSIDYERLLEEVEEDWITRPRSTEPFSFLCCMPGEF